MNVKLFREHIKVSNNYHLFCAHDDIAMQYLNKNIYNIYNNKPFWSYIYYIMFLFTLNIFVIFCNIL